MAAASAAATLEEDKAKSVLRQVEFYLGDSNLHRDKFLRKKLDQSADGLVSLAFICSFSRMKSHLGLDAALKPETMSEEMVLAVAAVLRRSSVLRVSEDGKRIGRASKSLEPEQIIEQVGSRTVAASPLPYNVKLEDVQSFFAQYAKVNSVQLPRHVANKNHFCGTALIEFSEEEEAKSVLENNLVFAGANLDIKPKKEFDTERDSIKKAHEKAQPISVKAGENEDYPKGLIVAIKLKRVTVDDADQGSKTDKVNETTTKAETSKSTEDLPGKGSEDMISESSDMKEPKSSDDMAEDKELNSGEATKSGDKGIGDALAESEKNGDSESLSMDGKSLLGNENNPISREDLKEAFKKFGTVRFVDFRIGDSSGYLRFEDSKAAEKACAFAVLADEGGLVVKGHIVTVEPVTDEAEKNYWNTIRGTRENNKFSRSYKGRSLNNKGRKQFNGKRGRHADSTNNASNKNQEVEATT